MVSSFLIFAFHRRPGDAMSYPFTLFGATCLIFCPGAVEGSEINLLRVQWQMHPNE